MHVEAVLLLLQTSGPEEHQASAHTVRAREMGNREAAAGRPANLVRLALQAGRWRGKEPRLAAWQP